MEGKIKLNENVSKGAVDIHICGEICSINDKPIDANRVIEVLREEYSKYGSAVFQRIDGSYALVIEDPEKSMCYLVRDKLGVQPVYFSFQNGIFAWADTMKGVIAQGSLPTEVNTKVLHNYLAFRYVCGRNTMFDKVYELLPGHYVRLDTNKKQIEEKAYWDIPFFDNDLLIDENIDDVIDSVIELSISSIQRSLKNPKYRYGILSSGGVDSSLIIALAARHIDRNFGTYFIGFENYDGDRSKDAKMVADLYDVKHHEFYLDAKSYASGLVDSIRIHEEPINHPGNVGTVLFFKYMKGKLDAVLLGEGVDTIFCGSKAYVLLNYFYALNPFRRFSKTIANLISPDFVPDQYRRYFNKIRDAMIMDPEEYMIHSFAECDYKEAEEVLSGKCDMDYLKFYKQFVEGCNRDNALQKYLMINEYSFLVEGLNSGFKFSSANRIINYYPFVDVPIVTLANKMSFKFKSRRYIGKYIIKRLAERYFPKRFIYQRKEGFGVPLKHFFNDPSGMGTYLDILTEKRTIERGVFQKDKLYKLLDEFSTGNLQTDSYESLLWTVINLELWFRVHIDCSL